MAGGTDVSASRASSEAVPQASAAATYFIFGNNASVSAATDQRLTATPTSTAVAATGGSAGASGTGGNGAAASGGGAAPGISGMEIVLILGAALGAFLLAKHL